MESIIFLIIADSNIIQKETQATALHLAASNNFLDIVDALIAKGAEVDCEDPRGKDEIQFLFTALCSYVATLQDTRRCSWRARRAMSLAVES